MLTAAITAWKPALAAPAATVTEEGTFTADELLERVTTWPPVGAAAFSVTVQLSVVAPVAEELVQLRLLGIACPVPLRAMVEVVPVEELLVKVTAPLLAPAVVGLKPIASVTDCPALSVNGKLAPESVKPEPLTEPALSVTELVPDEVSLIDCGAAEAATLTVPKLILVALTVNVDVAAPRPSE